MGYCFGINLHSIVDDLLRLRIKHDIKESVSILKKEMQPKQAKSLVEKVFDTMNKVR